MAKIRIVGDSSGYVELSAPNAAGNNTLELPSGSKLVGADANNNVNLSGIITATGGFSGNLTGNVTGAVNSSGIATFSNGVVVAAGTTAAPSISPTGDSNTGIFFPSADTIAFGEGGAEAARIDSSGNLGVGTASVPNWASGGFLSIQNKTASLVSSGTQDAFFTANAYYDGAWKYHTTGTARNIYMNSDGIVFRVAGSGSANASLSWTEAARFNSSGNLAFPSGQGIDFSATTDSSGTMTSELLDDYEVGTWTPTIAATSSNPTISYTSGQREGRYVKIGKLVYIEFWIRTDSCSAQGSGNLRISGLPFSEGSNTFVGQANFNRFDFTGATAGSGEHILGEVDGTVIEMRRRANTGATSAMATGSIPGGVSFAIGAATYTTA